MKGLLQRYKAVTIGGAFGILLMGATYAMADIGSIKYSKEAKSTAFTVEMLAMY
jgi:hypothetical protein